jgi:hypothetical protein
MLPPSPSDTPLLPAASSSVILDHNRCGRGLCFPLLGPLSLCDYSQSVRVAGVMHVKLLQSRHVGCLFLLFPFPKWSVPKNASILGPCAGRGANPPKKTPCSPATSAKEGMVLFPFGWGRVVYLGARHLFPQLFTAGSCDFRLDVCHCEYPINLVRHGDIRRVLARVLEIRNHGRNQESWLKSGIMAERRNHGRNQESWPKSGIMAGCHDIRLVLGQNWQKKGAMQEEPTCSFIHSRTLSFRKFFGRSCSRNRLSASFCMSLSRESRSANSIPRWWAAERLPPPLPPRPLPALVEADVND